MVSGRRLRVDLALARKGLPMGSTRQIVVVSLITAACLLPFVGKAFSVDDPLFLWAAEQIRQHPLDAYGFDCNWYGTSQPMWQATHNPPLASYYVAAVSRAFGMSEAVLHLAFIVPAIGVVLAAWRLARLLAANGIFAALLTLWMPTFLASSTSVMCDVLMTALFAWAVALWIDGLQNHSQSRFAAASVFVGAAVLAKYFALSLFPLLVACTLIVDRRQSLSMLWLLIAVAIVAAYEWSTFAIYGTVHLRHAMFIAVGVDRGMSRIAQSVVGLSFVGGCFLPVLCLGPLVFSKRVLCGAALVAAAIAVYLHDFASRAELGAISYHSRMTWTAASQLGIFIAAGALVLLLALDVRAFRNQPLLLTFALWIVGTFVFASYLNQQDNVRSMLPMAVPLSLLIARRVEISGRWQAAWLAIVPACAISLAVTYADYAWANAWRDLAVSTVKASGDRPLWFEGHWGFQWYLEKRGGRAVDFVDPRWNAGDLVAVPLENADTKDPPQDCVAPSPLEVQAPTNAFVIVMSRRAGAGFGSAFIGPLPFMLGRPDPQRALIFTAAKPGRDWASDLTSDARPP
jgi:hypothetical protein